jgi:hypothetical protein
MRKSVMKRIVVPSIALMMALLLFAGWAMADKTVRGTATFAGNPDLDMVRHDLAKIDGFAAEGIFGSASVIIGRDIKARDIYQAYINRAAGISANLLSVRTRLQNNRDTISLQQLGALTQRLSAENLRFKNSFRHGEEKFQTYQLIEKAVSNLEDAIEYWRVSNKYRPLYRGSVRERAEDDEILQIKLQTAMNAIEELKAIMETRDALTKNLAEE